MVKKKMLKTHNLIKKNIVKHFGGGCKGAAAAPLCLEEHFILISLKYAISFPFWSKIKNSHKIYWEKNMVKLFGVYARGRTAALPKKLLNLIGIKYAVWFRFGQKSSTTMVKFFFFVSLFFETSFQRPPKVVAGARALLPSLATPLKRPHIIL